MMRASKRRRLQQEQRNVLEEDLEFSDDEEDYRMQQQEQQHMEEISGAEMAQASMVLENHYGSHHQNPDETQGAAEAMVQLSAQYSYYQGETGDYNPEGLGTEGNMEVDASYDPSVEFLGGMMPSQVSHLFFHTAIKVSSIDWLLKEAPWNTSICTIATILNLTVGNKS
ncbi:hypothetical protein GWK47_001391 [Chionoecetes opilio]|uniref:Uncharacterized protein n=1 Tax=Chionoecetes opilio TaxID=41210 RepID=A0A8J4XVW9_CHIOP|nr:hypothetical protein GWK47_001391 [Chionoecetes opilio]